MAVSSHSTIFRRSDLPRLGAPALTLLPLLLLRWTLRGRAGPGRAGGAASPAAAAAAEGEGGGV
jgi:hypothetical protein